MLTVAEIKTLPVQQFNGVRVYVQEPAYASDPAYYYLAPDGRSDSGAPIMLVHKRDLLFGANLSKDEAEYVLRAFPNLRVGEWAGRHGVSSRKA